MIPQAWNDKKPAKMVKINILCLRIQVFVVCMTHVDFSMYYRGVMV